MDIREFQELLGDMLDELPEPFFDELNGGVIVSPREAIFIFWGNTTAATLWVTRL